jgi:hypothetical protein
MNIFAVQNDPFLAACDLPDKLVVKMPTESLQLLTPWAYNTLGVKIEKPDAGGQFNMLESEKLFYGIKGFAHHPCAKWLYESPANVHWLLEHAFGMADEYWQRYNKYHGTLHGLNQIRTLVYKNHNKDNSKDHTPFVMAMPEEFKVPGDPVTAYRNYINGYKGYAEWRYSKKPDWWDEAKHEPVRKQYLAEREAKRIERANVKHQRIQAGIQVA